MTDEESLNRHTEINESLGKLFMWQTEHQEHDTQAFKEISSRFDTIESNMTLVASKDDFEELKSLIKPISETYGTVISLGRWGKWGLGFILLTLSIGVALKTLLGK